MIPKIIHYCWLSNDPIPSNIQHYMDSWKKYLPDYEFIHWNFDKFDKSSSRWVSKLLITKNMLLLLIISGFMLCIITGNLFGYGCGGFKII